jgi:ribosomal protein S27E
MPEIDTEELDYCCERLFGHTDWEFVEDKDTHITIKFNVEDTREEEEESEVFKQAWCTRCETTTTCSKADYQNEFTCNTCGSEIYSKLLEEE